MRPMKSKPLRSNTLSKSSDAMDFMKLGLMREDFPALGQFMRVAKLPDNFICTEPPASTLELLKQLGMTAQLHLMAPGEIGTVWPEVPGSCSYVVPRKEMDGSFHVAVELVGPEQKLFVGWLLSSYGHYVEQIASGDGYKKGQYALRGTSFDAAVELIAQTSLQQPDTENVRQAADSLVAILNGAWIAAASNIDPSHQSAQMVETAIKLHQAGNSSFLAMFVMNQREFATVMAEREFYAKYVEQIGWTTEKGMALTMDAATTFLIKALTQCIEEEI